MIPRALLVLVAFAWWLVPGTASAAPSCAATTVSALSFGSPSLLSGAAVDTTATLSISCSAVASGTFTYCLDLNAGSGGTSGTNRVMTKSGGATLVYNFYQDAARTIPWGSRTNSSLGTVPAVTITGGSAPTGTRTIYGRIIASQQGVAPGAYSSTFSGAQVQFYRLASGQSNCATGTVDSNVAVTSPGFTVSASPIADCTISVGSLNFGTQGSLSALVDASSTMSASCTGSTPYTIGLGNGANSSNPAARKMVSGANSITYSLYLDAARTTVWSTATTASGTGTGSSINHIVYGRVPAQTTPQPGTYGDSVVATLTY